MTLNARARTTRLLLPLVAVASLTAAGCGSSTSPSPDSATPSGAPSVTPGSAASASAASLTVTDTWAKANTDIAANDMTGVFGKITNTGTAPITIVSGTNSASSLTELHETVMKNGAMVMQPVADGFTVEPGKTRELKPGSDHVMVMKMTKPLKAGDSVQVRLTTKDGGTVKFNAVAKVFTMGDEPYASASSTASVG
ncbi:MAG TPA: copper chaperone PCu(A)C [Dermatophilaceae bacterium]|nr:copper chaperone PCu(A)C [Dermatophilaceae bacterium]